MKQQKGEATKRWQFLREKAILDERAAYINGKTRGKEESKIETAIEMMKNNISLDIIAKCTGLSEQELEELLLEKV